MHRFVPAMASIAGARVKEVAVAHRARQFGESKYGLSRTYKVLLDLLAIKTVIGFAQRPLLWFGAFAVLFVLVGVVCFVAGIALMFSTDEIPALPVAGTGLLFGALGFFLIMGGAVGELVYATSDIDLAKYARMLAVERTRVSGGEGEPKRADTQ
jgi:hypothetical protein